MKILCINLCGPEWWSVILSAISTIAVIAIAIVQIRIQRHQTKAQEYELYKELYVIIQDANWIIEGFIVSIYRRYKNCKNIDELQDSLEEMQKYLYKISGRIEQRLVDFNLKTTDGKQSILQYLKIFHMMRNIITQISKIAQDDKCIRIVPTKVEEEYRYISTRTDETIQKSVIVSRFVKEVDAKHIDMLIDHFFMNKGEILELKYLETIAKHCKL